MENSAGNTATMCGDLWADQRLEDTLPWLQMWQAFLHVACKVTHSKGPPIRPHRVHACIAYISHSRMRACLTHRKVARVRDSKHVFQ
jgi:hypothetical protein